MIITGTAIEEIVERVANQPVVERIARTVKRSANQHQILYSSSECVIHRRFYSINIRSGFNDDITAVINAIKIDAQSTDHRVGSGPAIKGVITSESFQPVSGIVANDSVGGSIANAVDGIGAKEGEML